jgi:tetratricopeptide (TPR) repeat protein
MPLRNGLSEELNRQGNEHFARGLYTEAYTCYAKALECDRMTGDQRAMAATLGNLGNICAVSGRRESAQTYYQEVLELQKILGDEKGIGTTLGNLGNLRADAGEWDRARAYYLEALDLLTKAHDEAAKAVLLSDLGLVARENGQFDQAIQYYEHSLVLMRRLGNQGGVADAWRMIGRTFLLQKRYEDAIACCQTSQSIAGLVTNCGPAGRGMCWRSVMKISVGCRRRPIFLSLSCIWTASISCPSWKRIRIV